MSTRRHFPERHLSGPHLSGPQAAAPDAHARSVGRTGRVALWELPNVVSLDVPLIAVVWQLLLARTLGADLNWQHSALLGVAVWLIYSADRWLDGLQLGRDARTERHRFYVRHRRTVFWVWLVVGAAAGVAGWFFLAPAERLAATVLASLMLGYFLARHASDPATHAKEVQITVVFALGVAFLPGLNGARLVPLVVSAVLFAVLIFLNCALIAHWEGDHDHESAPFAARAPKIAARLDLGALGLAGCSLGAGWVAYTPLFFALGGSALLLYGLGYLGALGPAARRVLADAALLTPLLALFFV